VAFFATDVKRKEFKEKPDVVKISFKSRLEKNKFAEYHIVDDEKVKSFSDDDWERRVVAVFATGAKWQFKNFKWQNPAEIFDHVCGFHLHYEKEEVNGNILLWKCAKLAIGRLDTKRYTDKSVVKDFWQILGDWIASRNNTRHLFF